VMAISENGPVYRDPDLTIHEPDPYCPPEDVEASAAGWDIGWWCRLTFSAFPVGDPTGPMIVTINQRADVEQHTVTREQVLDFARHLVALVARAS
jgi:hypothetical protein